MHHIKSQLASDCLLSFSGGLDSTVLLATLLDEGGTVTCMNFCYGSQHNELEREAAKNVANYYSKKYPGKVQFMEMDVTSIFEGVDSPFLTKGAELPEGKYLGETMKDTVVPARNLVFGSIMASVASAKKIEMIALGIHTNDSDVYPDCSYAFYFALREVVREATGLQVMVIAPFVNASKAEIVERGVKLHVPFALTRTCYTGGKLACGKCGSCIDRIDAFKQAKEVDTIEYEFLSRH